MALQILSQRDPKWASQRLGWGSTNTSTIGSHGCTITSLAMLLGKTPSEINALLIKHQAYAAASSSPQTFNLVWWGRLPLTGIIKSALRVTSYNNDAVKAAISKYGGCLVEVDGSRIGATKHWVLYIGNGQMLDPWYGTQKTTSYYPPVGYAIIEPVSTNGGTTTPETTQELKYTEVQMTEMRNQRDENWDLYTGIKTDYEQFQRTMGARLETLAGNLSTIIDWDAVLIASARFKKMDEENIALKDKLERMTKDQQKVVDGYEERLRILNQRIEDMKTDHRKELEKVQQQVTEELESLKKDREKLSLITTITNWFSSLLKGK